MPRIKKTSTQDKNKPKFMSGVINFESEEFNEQWHKYDKKITTNLRIQIHLEKKKKKHVKKEKQICCTIQISYRNCTIFRKWQMIWNA
jgi:hypothetical protein